MDIIPEVGPEMLRINSADQNNNMLGLGGLLQKQKTLKKQNTTDKTSGLKAFARQMTTVKNIKKQSTGKSNPTIGALTKQMTMKSQMSNFSFQHSVFSKENVN